MFLYVFAPIEGPFAEVERALLDLLNRLPEEADIAYRKGEEMRSRLSLDGSFVAKAVRLEMREPMRGPTETSVSLTWEATGTPGLFPRMEGDLVVSSLGEDITHLALRGTYRPPLGRVGQALDRALLHRVAEVCVKRFIDALAAAVAERMARPTLEAVETS